MHEVGQTNRGRLLLAGALGLIIGACGGSDSEAVISSSDITVAASTSTLPPGTDPPSDTASTTTTVTLDTTTTTVAVTTVTTAVSTTLPDDTVLDTTTVPTTVLPVADDDIDEARLALAAAGLYTLPGTGAPCSLQDSPVRIEYLFPAAGGDLYMVCVLGDYEPGAPIDAFDLRLTRPDGSTAIEASLDDFGDGRSLVIRRNNRAPIVLGEYGTLNQSQVMIPIYLPDDRPAGTWRADSAVGTGTLDIDRPCAGQNGPRKTDPLDIPPTLQFARGTFVDFDHCRTFPDATNVDVAAATDRIEAWAQALGIAADIVTDLQCADDAQVIATSPAVDEVYRWFAGLPVHPVELTLDDGCVSVGTTTTSTTTTTTVPLDDDGDGSDGPDVDDVDDGPTDTDPG